MLEGCDSGTVPKVKWRDLRLRFPLSRRRGLEGAKDPFQALVLQGAQGGYMLRSWSLDQ
jgi:hypothetical protein